MVDQYPYKYCYYCTFRRWRFYS